MQSEIRRLLKGKSKYQKRYWYGPWITAYRSLILFLVQQVDAMKLPFSSNQTPSMSTIAGSSL